MINNSANFHRLKTHIIINLCIKNILVWQNFSWPTLWTPSLYLFFLEWDASLVISSSFPYWTEQELYNMKVWEMGLISLKTLLHCYSSCGKNAVFCRVYSKNCVHMSSGVTSALLLISVHATCWGKAWAFASCFLPLLITVLHQYFSTWWSGCPPLDLWAQVSTLRTWPWVVRLRPELEKSGRPCCGRPSPC